MLPTGKLVESVFSCTHSDELLASNTVLRKIEIEDSHDHDQTTMNHMILIYIDRHFEWNNWMDCVYLDYCAMW